jgi:hypothetical protein
MHHVKTAARPRTGTDRAAVGREPPGQIFQGYDTFAGAYTLSTIVGGKSVTLNGREGCSYTVCDTVESLCTSIDVSVDAAADFAFGSVDAKTAYVNKLSLTTTSIVIVVHAHKILGRTQVTDASVPPEWQPPGDDKELIRFHQQFGDSFVSEIETGAEYIATYTFYCQSASERTQVQAALSASGIAGGGEVSANLESSIQNVVSSQSVRISFAQEIFGCTDLKLPIEQNMIQFGLDFPTHTPNAPAVTSYKTKGYEHATGMIRDDKQAELWKPVIANRRIFHAPDGVNAQAAALVALENQVESVRTVYDVYNYTDDEVLRSRRLGIADDKRKLKEAIEALDDNPTIPFEPPKPQSLIYGSPVLTFDGPAVPDGCEWGGSGGEEFLDVTRRSVREGVTLVSIQLNGNQKVDQLACTYSNGLTTFHGQGEGKSVPAFPFGDHEYIGALAGGAGATLDRLKVTSSKRVSTEAGGGGGDPWAWSVEPGSVVVGLAGKCGRRLDRVGPLVCTFHPATWETKPGSPA